MRVLIAPDKFKGTLSSAEAARALAAGAVKAWERTGAPAHALELVLRPLADGGEGSLATFKELRSDLTLREALLTDCTGHTQIHVPYLSGSEGGSQVLFLESSLVVGLMLAGARETPIWKRTTQGIAEWVMEMARLYADAPLSLGIFLGGSATSDGGFGAARTLGYRFYADDGREVTDLALLTDAVRIQLPGALRKEVDAQGQRSLPLRKDASPLRKEKAEPFKDSVRLRFFSDVENPLTGAEGCARLFSPQKGASAQDVERLELCMEKLRHLLIEAGRPDMNLIPGAGAAGGMAVPFLAHPYMEAQIESGSSFFLKQAGIDALLESGRIDLMITGEGSTDASTLTGKLVHTIRKRAQACGVQSSVISGRVKDHDLLQTAGYDRLDAADQAAPPGDRDVPDPREAARRLTETTASVLFR
ncbi:MAG: glycerate kinase [Spirochaetia bacterium]|nr:glycerate kinase [Spirochaetia bacterium]